MKRYVYRMLNNDSDAEDVVAEAFFKLAKHDGAMTIVHMRAWLFRVSRNLAVEKLRKRRCERLPDEFIFGESDGRLSLLAISVREAVSTLPDLLRKPVILSDLEAISPPEAAAMMGISLPAYKSRLHRARGLLRDKLQSGFG